MRTIRTLTLAGLALGIACSSAYAYRTWNLPNKGFICEDQKHQKFKIEVFPYAWKTVL